MFNIQNTIIYCQHIIEHTVSNSNRFLVLDFSCEKVLLNGMMVSDFSVQSLSHVWLFATPWTAAHQASLSITNSWSLLKLMSIESVMPSNRLILCHPLLLLPSIFPSIRGFSNESALCIRWPKYWSCSFNISPFNEYSGLISFRMDRLDLLARRFHVYVYSFFRFFSIIVYDKILNIVPCAVQ